MNAEEIVSNVFDRYFECIGGRDEDLHEFLEREIPKRLREAGLLLEWRADVENAPAGEHVTAYREDAGVFPAMYGSMEHFGLNEREIENIPEGDFFSDSWWSFDHDGAHRLEGDETPTLFAIIKPPEQTNDMA